ncbi:MAG TPA: chemotaxis protein CheB [Thermoanaerobaculia bacterium]|nr:chemotaxis protein CheB [Thermoanaerobaculia bacterium]
MSVGGYEIVIVGTSWGGLAALRTLAGGLPRGFGLPTAVVQHRHKDSDRLLTTLLQERTALTVLEVEDKQPILPGFFFIAPPDYHLLVERGHFSLSTDAPVRYSRPSIDVAFMTAADSYGPRAVGIVLTGANADGADGLAAIAENGGLAIVQSPATAESPTMPRAALEAVPSARVMPIPAIVDLLVTLPVASPAARAGARADAAAEGRL